MREEVALKINLPESRVQVSQLKNIFLILTYLCTNIDNVISIWIVMIFPQEKKQMKFSTHYTIKIFHLEKIV